MAAIPVWPAAAASSRRCAMSARQAGPPPVVARVGGAMGGGCGGTNDTNTQKLAISRKMSQLVVCLWGFVYLFA